MYGRQIQLKYILVKLTILSIEFHISRGIVLSMDDIRHFANTSWICHWRFYLLPVQYDQYALFRNAEQRSFKVYSQLMKENVTFQTISAYGTLHKTINRLHLHGRCT